MSGEDRAEVRPPAAVVAARAGLGAAAVASGGFIPWPGRSWTRRPAGNASACPFSSEKASHVSAAAPGASW